MRKLTSYKSKLYGKDTFTVYETGTYQDGTKRLQIIGDRLGPICTLTTHVSRGILKDRCYMIKTWMENESVTDELLRTGIFEDTGLRHPTGWEEASIWLFVGDKNEKR